MVPDATDWEIMNELSSGNLSNTELARRLSLAESTVRQRLRKLQEAGILKVQGLRNPNKLENQQLALVAVGVSESRLLSEKATEIAALEHVLSASVVSGQYDIMAEVLVDSNHGLMRFLSEELSTVRGLTKTETFLMLHSYNKWV